MLRRSAQLALLLLLLLLPGAPAAAAQPPPSGADIVFVVDQSGSMSRGTVLSSRDWRCTPVRRPDCPRTPPTDPDGLAIRAVKDGLDPIFERMVRRSLGRQGAGGPPEEYRFGLVLFGGSDVPAESAVAAVPLTRIEIVRDAQGMLEPNIVPMLPTSVQNLGETAFSRAFDAACEMLDCATGAARPARRQVVVLLTDGQPSLDAIEFDPGRPDRYFTALRQAHAGLFARSELWVLGLDRGNQFWAKNAPYWDQIAPGRTYRLTDPKDIATRLRAIARATVGDAPGDAGDCAAFTVEPYRSSLALILEYSDLAGRATITMPNGQPLGRATPGLLGYSRSAQTETFIIDRPAPGGWRCAQQGAGVAPRLRAIPGDFTLADVVIAPASGASVSPCHDFNLSISYLNAAGQRFAELPDYPLAQTLELADAGAPVAYPLLRDQAAPDRWLTGRGLKPSPLGDPYTARVDVRLASGAEVFSATRQVSVVDPALPCLRHSAPDNGSASAIYQGLSMSEVELAVTLTQRGQPSSPAGVFREDLAQIVTGRLDGPAGYSRTLALLPLAGQAGVFAARVPDLAASGAYTFTAQLRATTQAGEPYTIDAEPISFRRVVDPLWTMVRWGLGLGALLALLGALALAGFAALMISGPYPRGTLVLEQRPSDALDEMYTWSRITSIALDRQRVGFGLFRTRWITIPRRALRGSGLRAIQVRRVVRGKTEGVQVTLLRDDQGKKVALQYQFTKDQEFKIYDGKYRISYEAGGAPRKAL